MDLVIENVEQLTLHFPANGAKPSLVDVLQGLGVTITRVSGASDACNCEACQAARAVAKASTTASAGVTSNIPSLGSVWPGQGGVNGGLMRGIDGQPDYYQIVAVGAAGGIAEIAWAAGSCDDGETEAKSKNDGMSNTRLLAESALDFPAAKWARSLTIEGHSDFYLPSQRELAVACATVPEVFDNGYHWSSTQYSRYLAWCQFFVDGSQTSILKSAKLRARAFRRFIP